MKAIRNSKFIKMLVPDTRIYLIMLFIFILIISYYNKAIGIIGIFLLAYLIYYNLKISNIRREEWTKYIEGLSSDIDSATKYAVLNLPIPLTIVEFDGTITWYNRKFLEVLDTKDLLEKDIQDIIPNFDLRNLLQTENELSEVMNINNKYFKVVYNIVKLPKGHTSNYIIMLYWIDVTKFEELAKKYYREQMVVGLIQVDNYDEVMQSTEEMRRPLVGAEIEHRLNLWAGKINGFIRKYSKDKFMVIFQHEYLEKLEQKKFEIIDEIREINQGNTMPITLSIGIGVYGENALQTWNFANGAKDLALGRGGDQVAVKKGDKISFYGGKAKAVEKRTKVKARVVSHALRELIDQSTNVIVMGHKISDLDAFGSALGIYRAAKNRGKDAYIVLNGSNPSIEGLLDRIYEIEEYNSVIISCDEAKVKTLRTSLLVVVDTHRPNFTECPELLKISDKIVLIDHHRKGTDFIENAVLNYHETYASSTSELVTELLSYMEEKISMPPIEADALLAGIAVDTKNFTFKTGVRTFEAASILRRAGADTTSVKQLFEDEFNTIITRADVIRRAEIIYQTIAISTVEDISRASQLIAAQAADELLDARGITASFVLGRKDDTMVFISGRSMGDINVQVILEKLGGGGHMTIAGAQIEGISMEEAKEALEAAIEEYFEEGEEE
ncbi:DHH family phosphoesterase [Alkaliphilus oremlandii]|uniref:Cyclic-di-AMP phosphodiesterase n=1 Tax=Alkaliphilus oremlandii (strain OhILAs) TaxID=350688 RepID=A8MKJ8_ALKOO|nr:DHH family phosphoesterase [Alkaliphilus oremlandii]ABW20330.1 phosphoesterase RecJ domain protein [Alkaliphilus oremlandii OhILAs]